MRRQLPGGENTAFCLEHLPLHARSTQEGFREGVPLLPKVRANRGGVAQGLEKHVGIRRGAQSGKEPFARQAIGNKSQCPHRAALEDLDKVVPAARGFPGAKPHIPCVGSGRGSQRSGPKVFLVSQNNVVCDKGDSNPGATHGRCRVQR